MDVRMGSRLGRTFDYDSVVKNLWRRLHSPWMVLKGVGWGEAVKKETGSRSIGFSEGDGASRWETNESGTPYRRMWSRI